MNTSIAILFFGILGSIFGSFASLLIYRIPKGISVVSPRSFCINCNQELRVTHLIPIFSFVLLRGKCFWCKKTFSLSYILYEIILSSSFIFLYLLVGVRIELISLLILAFLSVPLFVIDVHHLRLPNMLTYSGILLGIGLSLSQSISLHNFESFKNCLIYGGLSFLFYYIINLISKGGMGLGDAKLAMMIGSLLYSYPASILVLANFLGFLLGAIYGIFLILKKRASRKTGIPFGPFLILGVWCSLSYCALPPFGVGLALPVIFFR